MSNHDIAYHRAVATARAAFRAKHPCGIANRAAAAADLVAMKVAIDAAARAWELAVKAA